MAVHLSRSGRRKRQSADHSRRHAGQSGADLLGRDEQLLCAAAWQPDLHHGGNDHPSSSAGRLFWNIPRNFCSVQRRRLFRHAFRRRCRDEREVRAGALRSTQRRSGAQCEKLRGSGEAECCGGAIHLSLSCARSVRQHPGLRNAVRRCNVPQLSDVNEGGKMNLLGRLNWNAIPFDQPIIMGASGGMVLVIVLILSWVTLKGYVPYLWREWLTSVDHKRIGIMYIILALIMLLRGFADAIMMRAQQAVAAGGAQGYLPPEHFDQIFSAHGTIMIFFMAMPFVIGMMNFVVPLQLGVRDMAFPTLNSVALGLTASGILLTNISLVIGEVAKTGLVAYPPLSELQFSPGVGVDYYLWALQISGVGTLMTGINFVATILKTRAPGMSYMRMPVFCWTSLAANLLIVAAFPVLTATLAMLLLDRYLCFHFFQTH